MPSLISCSFAILLTTVAIAGCANTAQDAARAEAERQQAEREDLQESKRQQLDRLDENLNN